MGQRTIQLLLAGLIGLTGAQVWANPGGISGYSGKGGSDCTSCHGGGATPTVSLSGPTTLTAGQSGSFTLTIKGGPAVVGGFDVASSSNAALLTAGTGSALRNGEVVQSSAKGFSGGAVSWAFSVKAPSTAGSFTLFASGLSADGSGTGGDGTGLTTHAVTVTAVAVNQPPTATLSGPVSGASFTAPANISLIASASDLDGTVAKVEFFSGTTKLGEDLTAPYSFSWNNVPQGSYTLSARATDNLGLTGTSASVKISVMGVPPPPVVDAGTPIPVVDAGTPTPVVDAGSPPPPVVDAGSPPPPPAVSDAGTPPSGADGGTPCAMHGHGKCRPPRNLGDGGSAGQETTGQTQDDLQAPTVGCSSAADGPAFFFAALTLTGLALRRRLRRS